MFHSCPSRPLLRFVAPILIVSLLVLPVLAQQSAVGGKVVATWGRGLVEGYSDGRLIYKNGKMLLEMSRPIGGIRTPIVDELIERPPKRSGERRFDLEDNRWSEYLILSKNGFVELFSWEGDSDGPVRATSLAPDAMTIGKRAQSQACARRQLSPAAQAAVRLHRALHQFKDHPEFARLGVHYRPALLWRQAYKSLDANTDGGGFTRETGFNLWDLELLFDKYLWAAIAPENVRRSDLETIEFLENAITKG